MVQSDDKNKTNEELTEKEILLNRPSRSAKLRYGIRNNKKYFFPNELTEKFKNYLEIEGMGSHL